MNDSKSNSKPSKLKKTTVHKDNLKNDFVVRDIYKNIPTPIQVWQKISNDFILLDYNSAADQLVGGKLGTIVGIRASELFKNNPNILNDLHECIQSKISISREISYTFQDTGETKYLFVKYIFVEPDIILGYHQDISKRKKAELKLSESNKKYGALFEQTPVSITIFSEDGYLKEVNPATEALFGYKREELVNKHFSELDLYAPGVLSIIKKRQIELKTKEVLNVIEIQIKRKNGDLKWVTSQVSKVRIGEKEYFQEILQDIDDLRQTQRKLSQKEEDYKNIIENLSDLVIKVEIDGTIHYVSPQIEEMFGYKQNDLIGKNSYDLIHPEDVSRFLKAKKLTEHTGEPLEIEFRMKKYDGNYLCVSGRGSLIEEDGKLELLGIIRDISPKKDAELQIKRRLNFEKLISKITSRFAGIIDFNKTIFHSLKDMGEFIEAKRAYLFLFDENKNFMSNTNEWVASEYDPQISQLQRIPLDNLSSWMKQLSKEDYIHILNSDDVLNQEKYDRDNLPVEIFLQENLIDSILVYPIKIKGKLSGFLGFDGVLSTQKWKKNDFLLFKIPSEIIGNVLERKYVEQTFKGSQEILKNVLGSLNSYIIIINKDFDIIWINNLTKNLFSKDIMGQKCHKAFLDSELVCNRCIAQRTFKDNQKHETLREQQNIGGAVKLFHCVSNPITLDSEGKPELIVIIANDITNIKKHAK
jgi:PAS domain S-box-containing protein